MRGESAAVILAALLAPLMTYLVARRQRSGRVGTTEAAQLWTESTMMRKELRETVMRLEERVAQQDARIRELERERAICYERIEVLEAQIKHLQRRAR